MLPIRLPVRRGPSVVGAGLALMSFAASSVPRHAEAQVLREPEARQGFYVSFGGGMNGIAAWDKGHRDGVAWGATYTLRLGEMLTDRFGLGLAIDNGVASRHGLTDGVFGLTLEGQARLWRHLAVHLGTGLGAATVKDPTRADDETHGTYGAVVTTSLSYDAFFTGRPSGGWAVTPALGLRAVPGGDVDALSAFATLSVTWWSGLPARELREAVGASNPR
jgi:hypothetical protein